MKKIITLITLSLLIISCGKSKEEQMIYDFVAKGMKENINIDLKDTDFKINSVEKLEDIKASDSLAILLPYYEIKKKEKIEELNKSISNSEKTIKEKLDGMKTTIAAYGETGKKYALEDIEREKKSIETTKSFIKSYQNDAKGTFLESVLVNIKSYKVNPEKILSSKYKANYSMTNPLLKVKQTFDKVYYTDSSGNVVVKSEDIK